jgi:hypothetical protein
VRELAASNPAIGMARGLRAAALAIPTVGVGLLAHRLNDGCLSALGALTSGALCWSAAVLMLGRQAGVRSLLRWTVAAQAITHLALSVTCPAVTAGRESLLSHLTAGMGRQMLLAHVVSAIVCSVVLARADAGLWAAHRLLHATAKLVRSWIALRLQPPAVLKLRRPPISAAVVAPRLVVLRLPARRGPPVAVA